MSAVKELNPNSEVSRQDQALRMNLAAARGLQEVLKSNLGPKGTIKMLVGGGGDIKLTKDGSVLLHEMQIQHPTAQLIARCATAQDEITGDGTTSIVLLIGELMRQSERCLSEGVHPRAVTDGFEAAKQRVLEFLESYKRPLFAAASHHDATLSVARTSLRTKVSPASLADQLADIVTEAVEIIEQPDTKQIDLFMVEVMHMKHHMATDTRLVRGLVLDHGARHHDMPSKLDNCFIMTCNVSMEYEKSEVNSSQNYNSVEQRSELAKAERSLADEAVRKAIALKKKLVEKDPTATLVVINQKGIDPPSLQMFADEGILAIRRAKRRNMERLTLACGGIPLNSLDGATIDHLGHADHVYEEVLGEDKYTFVEGCKNPRSCTVLVKGSDDHTISQIKDAVRDGLRSVKNVLDDKGFVVPGAGAFEIAAHADLLKWVSEGAHGLGKARLGVEAFARALLVIPKTLALNAGFDQIDTLLACQDEHAKQGALSAVGVDLATGKPMDAAKAGIWDNTCVKKHFVSSAAVISEQLLLVDVVMRAGRGDVSKAPSAPGPLE